MALQKAIKGGETTPFKFTNAGDTIKGYYHGQSEKMINGSKVVESLYKTKTGILSVLGQAHLLSQIRTNNIEIGNYVEIVFSGQVQKLKGGRTMKVYDVSFDRDDNDTSSENVEAGSFEEAEDEETEDETTAFVPPTPPKTPATPPNAERQAKVKDLLKSRAHSL